MNTLLVRITAILERARIDGGWIDEQVAADVIAEMRANPPEPEAAETE